MTKGMMKGWSDAVRQIAERDYVKPALATKRNIRIRVGDIKKTLQAERDFPTGNIHQICSALESDKFIHGRLELLDGKGKPRKVDTVYEFSFPSSQLSGVSAKPGCDPLVELRGVLKGAIREGANAFLRELRRDRA